jgi:hypothetical protein
MFVKLQIWRRCETFEVISDKLNVYRIGIDVFYTNMWALECARTSCFDVGSLVYDNRTVRVD